MVNFGKHIKSISLIILVHSLLTIGLTGDDGRTKIFQWESGRLHHDKVKEMGYTSLPATMKTPAFQIPARCRIYIDGGVELAEGGIGCLYGGHWWLTRSDGTNIDNSFYGWPNTDGKEIHAKEYIEPGSYHVSFSIQHNINIPFICEQKWSFAVYVMPDLPQLIEESGEIFTWEGLKEDPSITVKEGELSVLPGTVFEGNGEVKLINGGESCSIKGDLKLYQPGLFCKIVTSGDGKVEIIPKISESGENPGDIREIIGFLSAGTRFLGTTAKKAPKWAWENKWSIAGGGAIAIMTGIPGFVFTLPATIGARALGKNWDTIAERVKTTGSILTYNCTLIPDEAPKGYAVTMVKSSCILYSPDGKGVTIFTFKGEAILSDINKIKTVRILPGYVASCKLDELPSDPMKFSAADIEKKWEEIVYEMKTQKSSQPAPVPAEPKPEQLPVQIPLRTETEVKEEAAVSEGKTPVPAETTPETIPDPVQETEEPAVPATEVEPVAPVQEEPETDQPVPTPPVEAEAHADFIKNETIQDGLYSNRKWNFQVKAPTDSWEIVTGADAAEINRDATVVLKTGTAYSLIIAEKLPGMDMNTFKNIALPRMENRQVVLKKPFPLTGTEGLAFELEGSLEGNEFVFYSVLLKKGDFFYQIHCWTLKSIYGNIKPDFDRILKSFLIK